MYCVERKPDVCCIIYGQKPSDLCNIPTQKQFTSIYKQGTDS